MRDPKEMVKQGFNEHEFAAEFGFSNTAAHVVFEVTKDCIDVAAQLAHTNYQPTNYRSDQAKKFSIDYQKDDLVGPGKYTRRLIDEDDELDRHPLDGVIGPTIKLVLDRGNLFGSPNAYRSGMERYSAPIIFGGLERGRKYKPAKVNV